MFTFLHTADIHLDSPLHKLDAYEGAPTHLIRQAARAAFENLVNLAIDEPVSFVLISGDLYDGDWKDYNTGLYFVSQMRRLRDAGIPVFIIAGNHDAASKITKHLKLPEGVTIFSSAAPETVTLDALRVAIHAQSFAAPAITKNLAAAYPLSKSGYFNIGMLHSAVTGREGHAPYAPCTLDDLVSKGYDYWALGHIHKREILNKNPWIVFPGNIQGRHIRETGEKGCMRVSVSPSGKVTPEFIPLDVIRWVELSVDTADAENGYDVTDRFAKGLESLMEEHTGIPLVVRVIFSGESLAHHDLVSDPDRWKNEIRAAAADISGETVWVEKIRVRTRLPGQSVSPDFTGSPVGQLSGMIESLLNDPDALDQLVQAELSALAAKLPPEVKQGDDPLQTDDPAWQRMILDQARSLLLARLMKEGDAG
jgi:DNA repair exonuclease SbcCD nuclease subunit